MCHIDHSSCSNVINNGICHKISLLIIIKKHDISAKRMRGDNK